jgi:3-oxoadipate enol-lactonase
MPHFNTNEGCRIYFEMQQIGSSKPMVVFLNGTAQNTVHWTTVSKLLRNRFRALTYDARAQGRSDIGDRQLSLETHAADLQALLRHLGIARAHLVGLSHGAGVALAFACRAPELIGRMVLCSVTAKPTCRAKLIVKSWLKVLHEGNVESFAWAALPVIFGENFLRQHEGILDKIVAAIVRRSNTAALMAHLQAMTSYPPLAQMIPGVPIPTLILSASDDPLVTAEGAQELAMSCAAQYRQISGVGHSIPAEAPQLFAEFLFAFLAED